MTNELDRADALAKLRAGYRLRVRPLTGGLRFAFLQSPSGDTARTFVVALALADALIADGTVTHRRRTKLGADVYGLTADP